MVYVVRFINITCYAEIMHIWGNDEIEDPTELPHLNPLSTKLYLSDLKTHFVPLSKHSLLRF